MPFEYGANALISARRVGLPLACIFHGDAFESGWMGVRFFVRLTSEYRDICEEENGKAHVQPPAIERVGAG